MFRQFRRWVRSSGHAIALGFQAVFSTTRAVFSPSVLPTTLGISTYIFVFVAITPGKPSETFYVTAAQIIPVLLLALAVESRFIVIARIPQEYWESSSIPEAITRSEAAARELAQMTYGIATVLALGIGEAFALAPLITADVRSGHVRPVAAAIGAGFAAILALAVVPKTRPSAPRDN